MRIRHESWFLLVNIGLATAGLALISLGRIFEAHGWAFHLLESLGDALLIAGVLGMTVDPYLKKNLTFDLFGSTLRAIYGEGLPVPVQNEIRRIAGIAVMREHFQVELRFQRTGGDAETPLEVTSTVEFEAHNIAQTDHEFEHVARVLERRGRGRIARVECRRVGSDYYEYHHEDKDVPAAPLEDGLEFRRSVSLHPGGRAIFAYETIRNLPEIWDDVMYFVHPTVGVRIRIIEAPPDLQVRILYMHNGQLESRSIGRSRKLELDNVVLLPNMSFVIRWRPKREKLPRPAPGAHQPAQPQSADDRTSGLGSEALGPAGDRGRLGA